MTIHGVIFGENHEVFRENVAPVFTQLKSEFHLNRICSAIVSTTDKITNSNKSSSTRNISTCVFNEHCSDHLSTLKNVDYLKKKVQE